MQDARERLAPGEAVALAHGVRRIVAPNVGMMTGPGTNTYLLGVRELAVIDPGPDDDVHLRAILDAAPRRIRWVIVTHTHRDHSPLAAVLARRSGACLIGLPPPADGRQDLSFRPDHVPHDGEALTVDGVALIAVHTPGHASNCVCYLLEGERLLFTGDHVLEGVSPVIPAPDGDMTAYLDSLRELLGRDFDRIAPGHGTTLAQGKHMINVLIAHRLAREAKIVRKLSVLGTATLDALTPEVYDDVPVERHAIATQTLEAHLIKLAREGCVTHECGRWRIAGS